jgi:hypothetical protein
VPDDNQVEVPACAWGDFSGSHTLVLLGDSHARMWLSAFDAIGKRLHWKVILLAKSNCPPQWTPSYDWVTRTSYPACDQWHSTSVARINQIKPDVVVMSSSDFFPVDANRKPVPRDVWSAALLKTIRSITSPRTTKVVLGGTPELGPAPGFYESVPNCLAAHEGNIQVCSTPRASILPVLYNAADQQAAKQAGVRYIDPFPWFCSSVCTAVIGNMAVYAKANHISLEYATFLSGALQEALQPAMSREGQ